MRLIPRGCTEAGAAVSRGGYYELSHARMSRGRTAHQMRAACKLMHMRR
jgi:hypothetical protein